ncbi:MAG TPA: uracil-DNA glycosylase [Elusimicrobia bacterium]|nr:uracil-DNA glycosylase [Elusimicrobiota bacterium]
MHQSGAYLEKALTALHKRIKNCQKCGLHKTRINVVFSRGSAEKGIIFIGEAPGYDEDRQGLPFVGRAGQLLDEVLASVGLEKEKVYVTNVVKCHPLFNPRTPEKRGNDRPPNREEITACLPVLKEQIFMIKPKIICTLGAVATNALLGKVVSLTKIRGKFYPFRVPFGPETLRVEGNLQGEPYGETKLFPTFHPAAIFRTPSLKNIFINDLKKLVTEVNTSAR